MFPIAQIRVSWPAKLSRIEQGSLAFVTKIAISVACGSGAAHMPMSYVYSLGQIKARFPRLVEKEFAQVASRTETAGKTDQQVFQEVLSQPGNRYLLRQMCWVFSVQGLDTYILLPRNLADYDLLVGATANARGLATSTLSSACSAPSLPENCATG